MTASSARELTPLVVKQACPISQTKWPVDAAEFTQDPLPAAVQHHPDGSTIGRETTLTEVKQETTDDH